MTKFMNSRTGSVDSKDGWLASYDLLELEKRNKTAQECFAEDEGKTLFPLIEDQERVIFDNGGGVTVQIKSYGHYYDDPAQAAEDVSSYLMTGNTDGWEGNEPSALCLDPTDKDIRNGGYYLWTIDIDNISKNGGREYPWGKNHEEFFDALINTFN